MPQATDRIIRAWTVTLAAPAAAEPAPKKPASGPADRMQRASTFAARSLVKGPQVSSAGVAPEVRKAVHERAAQLLATQRWCVLDPRVGLAPLQGGPAAASRALLDDFDRGLASLVADPAKGNKVSEGSIEEAAVSLVGRIGGVLAGPIERDGTGLAEFIGRNLSWDVKSPVSPPPGARWRFDAAHQLEKVRHDLAQGDCVLLNLSRLTAEDARTVVSLLNAELAPAERQAIWVLAAKGL